MIPAAVTLAVLSPIRRSFLKCWADRARVGQSVLDGRSYCENCGHTLAAQDLIPILSRLWQVGQSRCCRTPICPRLPSVEMVPLTMTLSAVRALRQVAWLAGLIVARCLREVTLHVGTGTHACLPAAGAGMLLAIALTHVGGVARLAQVVATISWLTVLPAWTW